MTLLIRDIGKIPYSCSYNNYPQSSSSWHAGDSSSTTHHGTSNKAVKKNCSISSIEDKARLLLSRNHFLNLIHNISEYGGRGMPVETFVTIILELLDTPEKVSLDFLAVFIVAHVKKHGKVHKKLFLKVCQSSLHFYNE